MSKGLAEVNDLLAPYSPAAFAYKAIAALRGRTSHIGYDPVVGVRLKCFNADEALAVAALIPDELIERVQFSWYTFGLADNVNDYLYLRKEAARAARC